MPRDDISPDLVHFMKGDEEAAYQSLLSIVCQQHIYGSDDLIKGNHCCICFTETPLQYVNKGLANPRAYQRYSPFGIMFTKTYIFGLGGRPVIYEPDDEYALLPDSHNWRHVRYEPTFDARSIDLTWEREWRLKAEGLEFSPSETVLVVPRKEFIDRLEEDLAQEHKAAQELQFQQYSLIMYELTAQQYGKHFHFLWRVLTIAE